MANASYPLMSQSVKAAAARLAKADGVSLNQFIALPLPRESGRSKQPPSS